MSDTEVGRITAVLDLEDGSFKSKLRAAEGDARGFGSALSKPIAIGISAGAAMAAIQGLISLAGELSNALGPGVAMSWEKGLGGVLKTVNTDNVTKLNDELLDLHATMRGIEETDIQKGAGILGSMDIGAGEIKGATQVLLEAKAAFDLPLEDTAKQLGVITGLWDEQTAAVGGNVEMMKKSASAVNELGNQKRATEKNLLAWMSEFGGTAGTYNIDVQEATALGGLLESKGIMANEGATWVRSALMEGLLSPTVETSKDTRGYKLAAQMLGIGETDMKSRLSTDFSRTLIDIISAVETQYAGNENAATRTQVYQKLLGSYGSQLSKLAGTQGEFNEDLAITTQGFEEGTSAHEEYLRQTDNLTDALTELNGSLDVLKIRAWEDALGPAQGHVQTLAQMVRDATPAIQEWAEAIWSGDPERMSEAFFQMEDAFMSSIESLGQKGIDAITAFGWENAGQIIGQLVGQGVNMAFEASVDLVGAIWDNREGILEGLNGIGAGFMRATDPMWQAIANGAYKAFIGIAEVSSPLFAGIETGFQSIAYIGGAAWNGLVDGAQAFILSAAGVIEAVAGIATALSGLPTEKLNAIKNDPTRTSFSGDYYGDLEEKAGEYGPIGFPFNFGSANVQVLTLDASSVHTLGLGEDVANAIGLGGYYSKMEESTEGEESAAAEKKKEKAENLAKETGIPKSTPKKKSDDSDEEEVDYSSLDPRTIVRYKRPSGQEIDIRVGDLSKEQQKNIVGLSEEQTSAAKESTQASKQSATATEKSVVATGKDTAATGSNTDATAENTGALMTLASGLRELAEGMDEYKTPLGEAPSYEKNLASRQTWIDSMKREARINEDIMSLDVLKEGILSGSGYDLDTLAKTGAAIAASPAVVAAVAPVVASAVTASAPSIAQAIATSPATAAMARQAVDKNSMSYLTGSKYFEDYPYEISGPYGYLWGKGGLPNVNVLGDVPAAWLSEGQPNGMDQIAPEILARQLAASGTSITPWSARGGYDTPKFLSDELTRLSPQYTDFWKAQKGGAVAELSGISASSGITKPAVTNRDILKWIYPNEGACIDYNDFDPSLNFIPGKNFLPGGKGFGNLDEPISLGSDEMRTLESIETNSRLTAIEIGDVNANIVSIPGMSAASGGVGGGGGGAGGQGWLSGKTEEGQFNTPDLRRKFWNAVYDNKGTCIAFVEPDPSLNFTPNPNFKGFGNMNAGYTSLGDQEISTWDAGAIEELAANREAIQEYGEATVDAIDETNQQLSQSVDLAGMSGSTLASILGGGGGGGAGGLSGTMSLISIIAALGGFGGASINGGGAWLGTWGTMTGMRGNTYYGSTSSGAYAASGGRSGWGGQASSMASSGHGSMGSVAWAEGGPINLGGIFDSPTYFRDATGQLNVVGETFEPELVLPLNNPARVRELLRMHLPQVRPLALGGLVGAALHAPSNGGFNPTINLTINGADLSRDELKRAGKEMISEALQKAKEELWKERR